MSMPNLNKLLLMMMGYAIMVSLRRRDGIGRRAGLKIPWWQHRMGSTPIAGTKEVG